MIIGNGNGDSDNDIGEEQQKDAGENFVDSPRQSKRIANEDKKRFYSNDIDDSESSTP
jgi:hypothetical protein|tara:strand:+ start:600 stop:773 length:174 start_codon:yes stop_codon:yes gene_type:complete